MPYAKRVLFLEDNNSMVLSMYLVEITVLLSAGQDCFQYIFLRWWQQPRLQQTAHQLLTVVGEQCLPQVLVYGGYLNAPSYSDLPHIKLAIHLFKLPEC